MANVDSNVVAALDIGTCSVNVIIGTTSNRQNNILGYGRSPSVGFKKGIVLDIEACAKSIKLAVGQAKKMSGIDIDHTYVGFSGGEIISSNVTMSLQLPEPNREITSADLELLIKKCRSKIHNNYTYIHLIPREFAVNSYWGVDDPIGMVASRIEMETHMVRGQQPAIQNLYKALSLAEITPKETFYTPLIVADQVLTTVEKEIGVMLLDIGGSSTGLCWYHRGKPWLTTSLPIGGEHITSDMAIGLRIPMTIANQIKVNFSIEQLTEREIAIPDLSTNQSKSVPLPIVKEIIDARLLEFTDLIKATIDNYGRGITPGELVLVGGGAKLTGIADFISNQLSLPVRIIEEDRHLDISVGTAQMLLNYSLAREQQQTGSNSFLTKLKSGFKNVMHRLCN